MRMRSAVVPLFFAAVLMGTACLADDDHQSATGHVDIGPSSSPLVIEKYSFAAILQPTGRVAGQFEFDFILDGASARVHGSVDCVTVVGNRARIGGTVRHSSSEDVFAVGSHFIWNVTDNGEGAKDRRDTASPLLGLPPEIPPTDFCLAGGFAAEFPLRRGNVQVRP